jgi:hypothetical protein
VTGVRRNLPLLLLTLLPCLIFPGAIPGPRVVSADDHLSVHHAFQDGPGGAVRHPQLSDPALQFESLHRLVTASLKRGEAPLWNPDLFAGAPLLADQSNMAGSPVVWLRLLLPAGAARDLGVWWLLTWTGVGTALLAGALRCRPWAAAVAGAAAMTGPYLSVWLLHPHAAAFCWIPWVLWSLETRRWPALAVCTAGLLLGGHAETAFAGLLFAAGWWGLRSRALLAVPAMLTGALLAMPTLLPFLEQLPRSATLAAHGGNTLPSAHLVDLLWPGWLGHPVTGDWEGGVWADAQLHPGLAALGLALFAARLRQGRWLLAAWVACLAAAVIGLPGPLNHARVGSIGAWWIALAAGLGAERLPRRWAPLALAAVAATGIWARWNDQGSLPAERHAPAPAAWTQALARTLRCPQDPGDPVGCGRVLGLGWALQPDTGSLVGLRDVRGYDLPVSMDLERFEAALDPRLVRPWFPVQDPPPEPLLAFAGVRALLSTEPLPGREPLDLGPAPLYAYAVDLEAPRAWFTPSPEPVAHAGEALARLRRADARARPPIEGIEGGWPASGRLVPLAVAEEGGSLVRIPLTDEVQRGVVVLADAWAPGWRAELDGRPVPCLRAGGYFRAALVEPGARELVFRYLPMGWAWGWRLGLAGLAGLLALAGLTRWRRRAE